MASPEEDEQQVGRVKDWINCCHLGTVELTDVLSNFPDVSLVLIEEIIDELVKEGTLSKAGTESYTIIKQKNCECELEAVKEEMEGHVVANGKNAQVDTGEDHMYMKACPEEDEQVGRVKDWINCCHLGTVELTDVLSNFPDVSLVLIEEIIDELVNEGTLSKAGTESYTIIKQKNSECELEAVKEEMEGHVVANGKNAQVDTGEDHMYMKTRKLLLFVACFFLAHAPSLVEGQVGQFALALQWIPSKCHHQPGKACVPRFLHVEDFTIHGLWARDGVGTTISCKNLPAVGRCYVQPARVSPVNNRLARMWPNLYGLDRRLWKHEYKKHGICFFQTSADYLADGLDVFQLAKQYLGMPITDPFFPYLSISTGIVAGSSYAPVDIVSRVVRKSVLGVLVIVRCGKSGGKSIIKEMDICAVRVRGSLQLANCSGNLFHSCLNVGQSLALLPAPPQPPIISSSPPPLPPSTPITAAIIPIVAPQFPQPQPLPPTLPSPTPLTLPPSSTPPLTSPSPPASPPLKSPSPSASPSHSSPPLMSLPTRPSPSPTQFSFRIVIRISVTIICSFVGTIFLVIYPIITFWRSGREQENKKKKKKKKKR